MNKKMTKLLVSYIVTGSVLTTGIYSANVQAAEGNVDRFAGADRYETASNVAKLNWTAGKTENVILVSGQGYADALSASLLAQKLDAPVLLTQKDKLNINSYEAINKLGAKNVYILGSEGVVSNNIKVSLEKEGKKVTRLGGRNRYETNIAIAKELITNHNVKADEVLVVNGNKYLADALTAAPVSAKEGKILLLVGEDEDSANEAKKFINNYKSKVTVIGGLVTVSDKVYNKLGATKRINGGKDRFETNRLILDAFDMKGEHIYVANGKANHLVDSLVASALAGKYKSPIVLVANDKDDDNKTIDYMKNKLKINNKSKVVVLGSEKILSQDFVKKVDKIALSTKVDDLSDKSKENSSKKFLDLVKEDGKTTIDEDLKKPGIQISLNSKESLKIKVVEKDDKTTVVKEINDKLIDLGTNSVVNKAVVGDTLTLTAIKEGKSTITITQGSQKLNLDITVKKSDLVPEKSEKEKVVPQPDQKEKVVPQPAEKEKVVPQPAEKEKVVPQPAEKEKVVPQPDQKEKVVPEIDPNPVNKVVEKDSVKASKVELKSEIEKRGVKGIWGVEQRSHIEINVFNNNGLVQNDHFITIAGKNVKVSKGDNPCKIREKIIEAFKDDENWKAEIVFIVVQGNKPVRVTLTRKASAANEDKLAIDTAEIKFTQQDEIYGRMPISEETEICNVTVTSVSNKKETINVNVTGEKIPTLNKTVAVDVNPTDTTKDVAKSIYNVFKDNEQLKKVYRIQLDEENSKVILTQRIGDVLDTKVTIK